MLATIGGNTIRQGIRSGSLAVACVVVTLLLWTAALAAYRQQGALNAQRAHYAEVVRTQWLEQPDRHPHRTSHYGYLAFRPKSALSYVDSGVDSFAGTVVFLEAHRQNTANFSEAGQSAATIRLGELTPALVLQLLAPLVIFLLGFDAISGEREKGTLALMLAQGVRHETLAAGKALGLVAMAVMVTLPGLAALLALPGAATMEMPARLGALGTSYLAYFAICALTAVLVSAWQRTSRGSLTALILLWIAACVAGPRVLQAWGAAMAPAPSKAEFDAALEADLGREGDSHNADDPHFSKLRAKVLAEYKVSDVRDLPFNYSALVMKESEEISSRIFNRHYGELLETFRRQGEPAAWGALVNPYLAVRRISMALAGSDLTHFIDFQRQAERFRYEMVQRLNDLHLKEIAMRDDRSQKVSRERWETFRGFAYRPPGLGEVLRGQWAALAALGVWTLMLCAAVGRGLRP